MIDHNLAIIWATVCGVWSVGLGVSLYYGNFFGHLPEKIEKREREEVAFFRSCVLAYFNTWVKGEHGYGMTREKMMKDLRAIRTEQDRHERYEYTKKLMRMIHSKVKEEQDKSRQKRS